MGGASDRGAVELSADFGPNGGHGFFDACHENAEVDVYAFEVYFVRAREVVAGDYVEEPEGFLLVHEKEEQACEVV